MSGQLRTILVLLSSMAPPRWPLRRNLTPKARRRLTVARLMAAMVMVVRVLMMLRVTR